MCGPLYVCGMEVTTYRKIPAGLAREVAQAVGCSNRWVWLVLTGRVPGNTMLAKRIEGKAAEILAELNKPA